MESTDNKIIEIIETEDGSKSLLRKDIEESYHSHFGALNETNTIYVNYGFQYFCEQNDKEDVNLLEIGFGTGLNAIATLKALNKRKLFYQTIELYPISCDVANELNYGVSLGLKKEFALIHSSNWEEEIEINPEFRIKKCKADACNFDFPKDFFDVVYFDAFSPDKDSELWSEEMFAKVYESCKKGAVLTTYCCKGEIKRRMKKAGFIVSKLPGPKGKREILRAEKA